MLKLLSRSKRIALGRLVALAYLLCVLTPGAALAFGSGPIPCLDEVHPTATHDSPMGHGHMHAQGSVHKGSDHTGTRQADGIPANASGGHEDHHHGKAAPGPCCALMCVSAIPVDPPSLVAPTLPVSTCASEVSVRPHGEAPAALYRPPIA